MFCKNCGVYATGGSGLLNQNTKGQPVRHKHVMESVSVQRAFFQFDVAACDDSHTAT